MTGLILSFLLSTAQAGSCFLTGAEIKCIGDNLNLNDSAKFLTGTADPTAVVQDAPQGSIYLRTGASGGTAYTKQDAGSTVNWTALAAGSGISQLTSDVTAGPGSGSQVATIAAGAVTNAKMASMTQQTIKGRAVGAGTGAPTDLTATEATAILKPVTSVLQGVAPASGGGTANFLRADATWTAPPDTGITQLTGNVTAGPGSGSQAATIAAGVVTRAMLSSTAETGGKQWVFLGTATASAAVRTGTITWTGTFKQLMFEYYISGCSGNAIGRLIVGPTAGLSETGTTFCTSLIEGVTINTTSVSVPGWPTAVTTSTNPRHGWMFVKNVAASVKLMDGWGQHSGTAPTTVPTQMRMAGMFSDATNLINKAELASYGAITGATVSANTFNAGTYLNAWGRNDD